METLNNLGVLYGDSGRSAEALSCYERALTIAEETLSPEHPLRATLLANAGTFHLIVHGPAYAEPFYVRALALAESTMGRSHALVGQIMLQYAAVLERTDRTAEAKKCRRRANTILEDASKGEPARHTVDLSELVRRSAKP
jgi:eukaryotic-like serine/threonine-protein kinase